MNLLIFEELSIFCQWTENGEAMEHFIELASLKTADAESIYSAMAECLKSKNIQLYKLIGMDFDGVAFFRKEV